MAGQPSQKAVSEYNAVKVEVYSERFSHQGQYIKVTEASLTYVAIDDNGKPREIPKMDPVSAI
jgi:acyl-CoA hydrolase